MSNIKLTHFSTRKKNGSHRNCFANYTSMGEPKCDILLRRIGRQQILLQSKYEIQLESFNFRHSNHHGAYTLIWGGIFYATLHCSCGGGTHGVVNVHHSNLKENLKARCTSWKKNMDGPQVPRFRHTKTWEKWRIHARSSIH